MKDVPIKVNVNADLTEASTELAKGTRSGGGRLLEALCGRRLAKVRADAQRAEAQAAVDDQLIRAGLARHENGQMVYLADAANCARFLACSRDQRSVENLSACLEEAAKAIDKDPIFSLPGKDIDLDFLDDWQDKAERTNSDYMRILWGRILKGELQQPGKYPRRILGILRNLTMEEAELFTKVARYAVDKLVVLNKDDFNNSLNLSSLLFDSGLFASFTEQTTCYKIHGNTLSIATFDCTIVLYFSKKLSGSYAVCSGYLLSKAGELILDFPDIEPINEHHLKKIFHIIKKNVPYLVKISAHPWKNRNLNQYYTDQILCEYEHSLHNA